MAVTRLYGMKEVIAKTGIKRSVLRWLNESGVFKPTLELENGVKRYSEVQLDQIKEMVKHGCNKV